MTERKFTKTQWKAMQIVTNADERRAQLRADDDGNMWLWKRANGHHVWAEKFTQFPFRNDLHRIMSPWFKRTTNRPVGWR